MPRAILSKEAFMTVHHGPAVGSGKQELPVDFQFLGNPRCNYFSPGTMPTQSSRGFPIAGNSDVPGTATRRLRKSNPPTNPGPIAITTHFCNSSVGATLATRPVRCLGPDTHREHRPPEPGG